MVYQGVQTIQLRRHIATLRGIYKNCSNSDLRNHGYLVSKFGPGIVLVTFELDSVVAHYLISL